jgi:putative ABC transport system permease protein
MLRESHRLGQGDDDFTVRNQTEIAKAATSTTSVMSDFAAIAWCADRRRIDREYHARIGHRTRARIGIRMAIGARSDVLLDASLSIVMSTCRHRGVVCRVWQLDVLAHLTECEPWSAVSGGRRGILGGGRRVFGYPARGGGVNPIQALRYE